MYQDTIIFFTGLRKICYAFSIYSKGFFRFFLCQIYCGICRCINAEMRFKIVKNIRNTVPIGNIEGLSICKVKFVLVFEIGSNFPDTVS